LLLVSRFADLSKISLVDRFFGFERVVLIQLTAMYRRQSSKLQLTLQHMLQKPPALPIKAAI
jgi:hypothetical protein